MNVSKNVLDILSAIESEVKANNEILTAKLDQFSIDIKETEKRLAKLQVSSFGISINVETTSEGYELCEYISWDSSREKIMYLFSEDDPSDATTLLGEKMHVRARAMRRFTEFLNEGLLCNTITDGSFYE